MQNRGFSIPVKGSSPSDATLLFPEIIPLILSPDRETRLEAIAALAASGDRLAVEPLFRACMDVDDLVKRAAHKVLATIAKKPLTDTEVFRV
jgi:HEAT repeat protein